MENHNTDEIGVQCLQCGLLFKPSANEGGYCPDCRLAEILLKDDSPAPDRLGVASGVSRQG
jgi:DNA-directed RNA polymerase subunit RPC12/RpoP